MSTLNTPVAEKGEVQRIHDRFIEMEAELECCNWQCREIYYWHLLRYNLFGEILERKGIQGRRQGKTSERRLKELLDPFLQFRLRYLRRFRWGSMKPAELLVFSHERQSPSEQGWYCPYTQPFVDALEPDYSRTFVHCAYDGVHLQPPKEDDTYYLEWELLWRRAARALQPWTWVSIPQANKKQLQAVSSFIESNFGVELPARWLRSRLSAVLLDFPARRNLYRAMLKRIQPKWILLVVHYSQRVMPLCSAARELGIPTAEVQHGLIGPNHLAYNSPKPGMLPYLPDYFLSFGEWWHRLSRHFAFRKAHCRAVGFPQLEKAKQELGRQHGGGAVEEKANSRKRIVFLSQRPVGDSISKWALHCAENLDASQWQVVLRLHPAERASWKKLYPHLVGSNVKLDLGAQSLYVAMQDADVQVGVYSTAIFEGVAFQLNTFIAKLPGYEASMSLVEGQAARLVDGPEAIVGELAKQAPEQKDWAQEMWREEPWDNFRSFEKFVNPKS